jgi:hypothetical protein
MGNTVKIINPAGVIIEAPEDANGVEKAKAGKDGWRLPEAEEVGGDEPPAPEPKRGRKKKEVDADA